MVSKAHIDALVTAGLDVQCKPLTWIAQPITDEEESEAFVSGGFEGTAALYRERRRELTYLTADEVGRMLWGECARSVMYRYPDIADGGDWPGPADFETEQVMGYTFQRLPGVVDPVVVLKALSCYEYQSCEHPEWRSSEAWQFCNALRDAMVDKLPGYEKAPWGIDDRSVFVR